LLVTRAWIPSLLTIIKPGLTRGVDFLRLPMRNHISVCRHFTIPREYFRSISNIISIRQIVKKIKIVAKNTQFDLIHAHDELSAVAAVIVGEQMSIPVVATLHGATTSKRFWRGSEKIVSKMLFKLNRLILVGDPLIKFYKKKTTKCDHFRIVPNGIEFSKNMLLPKKYNSDNKLLIISASNLTDEGKCIHITILALAKLLNQNITNWDYVIVGDGSKKSEYQKLVHTLNLQDKIHFIGTCSHQEVYHHLLRADIFCLPSCREAFGIAHLEAMAHGLLTIAVKGQGPQAFIEHDKTGLLVEPEDFDNLADTILYAFENRKKMHTIAELGRQHVLENFTWQKHAEKLISVYKEVCG